MQDSWHANDAEAGLAIPHLHEEASPVDTCCKVQERTDVVRSVSVCLRYRLYCHARPRRLKLLFSGCFLPTDLRGASHVSSLKHG
jgi:hypothetical protein